MEKKVNNILVVEHNQTNAELISNALTKFGFQCMTASDYPSLDEALAKDDFFDIVLMDITGFDAGIWERCKTIHQHNIPLLILSSKPSAALQMHGIQYGARGIVTKPVVLNDFVKLIYSLINDEQEK